jgi:hypothetical protein
MQQVVKKPSHQGKRLNRVTIKRPQAGCAQAYAPGWGIAHVKGNDGACREKPVTLSELFRSTLLLQFEIRIGAFPELLRRPKVLGGIKNYSSRLRVR